MWNLIKDEPVLFQGVIQAALALAAAFGSGISTAQVGSILALSAAVLSWVTRSRVTPIGKIRASEANSLALENSRSRG
jgi:hypothetical protein